MDSTLLSVVVTIVDAGEALERCLRALAAQEPPAAMEVIVPYDDSVPDIAGVAARFPRVMFLPIGTIATRLPRTSAGGQHELFDRRRAAGLAQATGNLVAILEDRGAPRPNWAAEARRLHGERPNAVIGGAIENGVDQLLNWAVYFCDFGRYQLPFEAGGREWVSDVNVCYKRRAIDATEALWRGRYHEPVVHGALMRAGEVLWLSPALVVDEHRGGLALGPLLGERVAWGRLFGSLRTRDLPTSRRVGLAALSPLLPFVLFLRHARMQWSKRVNFDHFTAAAPIVLALLCAWSAGEFLGYLRGDVGE